MSDGTYSDVLETTKVDRTGEEAAATQIAEYPGQLIANLWDDATKRVVEMYDRGTKVWLVADATERNALGSDDDLAANDLAFQVDTLGINYCVSVDGGAASTWAAIAATGNVAGPGASTDNAIARWDGASGATLQNSVVIVTDLGALSGITDITLSGTCDGRNVSADGATLDAHVASIANPHSTLLSQALVAGNTTSGTHVLVTNGDEINGQDGGFVRFAAGTGVVELSETAVTGDLAVSGKLTVVGLIDPTGLVLDEQAASPFNAAGKLTLWAKDDIPTTLWYTDDAGNDYQVGTDASAGLSAVLAIGATTGANDIVVTNSAKLRGVHGSSSIGGDISVEGGDGDGTTNSGGQAFVIGGQGAIGGAGGQAFLSGGPGGSTSGSGGNMTLQGGDASAGNSDGGDALVSGGQASGSGTPGYVTLAAPGAITGNTEGGHVLATSGAGSGAGAGGRISFDAGDGGLTGDGGYVALNAGAGGATSGTGGSAFVTGGQGTGSGATGGAVEIVGGQAGTGAATGGAVSLLTGDGGATSGNSGSISIATGAVNSGTRGTITLDASDVIVANQTYHSVRGATARGSTNTLIYRWTSVVDAVGTGITYTDSATDGGSWAITQAGVYCVSCSVATGHAGLIAIKKAAAVSNTFDATDIQAAVTSILGTTATLSWTGYCSAGDDIWIATNTATNPTGTPVNNNRVTVTRVR